MWFVFLRHSELLSILFLQNISFFFFFSAQFVSTLFSFLFEILCDFEILCVLLSIRFCVCFCAFSVSFHHCFHILNNYRFNKQMKINTKRIAALKAIYTEITRKNEEIKRMKIQLHEREYLRRQSEKANASKKKNKRVNQNANINNYSNVNLNFTSNNNNNTNSNNNGNSVGNNNNTRIENTNEIDRVSLTPTICWDSETGKPKSIAPPKSQRSKPRTKLQSKKEIDDSTDSNAQGEVTPPPHSIAMSNNANDDEGAPNSANKIVESININTMSHVVPDDLSVTQSPNHIPSVINETESKIAPPINTSSQSNIVPPITENTPSQVVPPTTEGSDSQLLLSGGAPLSTQSLINCDLNVDCAVHNGEEVDELDLIQRSTSSLQGGELSKDGKQSTIENILTYQDKLTNLLREWLRVDGSKQSLKKKLFQQLQDKLHHTTSILNYNLLKALKKSNAIFSVETDRRIDELSKLIEQIENVNNQIHKEELEKQLALFFLPGK